MHLRWMAALAVGGFLLIGPAGGLVWAQASPALDYFSVSPCRVLDTRVAGQGPALASGVSRLVTVTGGTCGIPVTAQAITANVTSVAPTGGGNLKVYPGGGAVPPTSALNFAAGQTRANNGVFPLAGNGSGTLAILATVTGSGTVNVVLDVTGYFDSSCGDGVRSGAEQCDDGNTVNLDGCDSACRFEQVLRINSLTMQFGTSSACTPNAFGAAFTGAAAQAQVQTLINTGIANGSLSNLLQMGGLDDLTGTSDPALSVGIMGANVVPGGGYNGSSDLDWWYTADPASIDATRKAKSSLSATIVGKALTAGPGSASLTLGLGASLALSSLRLSSQNGATSVPLVSAGSTPGHLPSEHLDPLLSSFASTTSGTMCGNLSAESLAVTPVPTPILCGTQFGCNQCYTAANSLLDVLVGGCTINLFGTQITPTQPDQQDPGAPPAGGGPPYTLVPDGGHFVTTCHDVGNAVVPLAACLKDAAYSSYFTFAAGRVIAK